MKNFINQLKEIQGSKKYTIIISIISILLLIGASYALITTGVFSGQRHGIVSGTLSTSLTLNTSTISINNAVPVTDAEGIASTNNSHTFTVSNTGSVAVTYRISLTEETIEQQLSSSYVRYSIKIADGDWSSPLNLEDSILGRTIWAGELESLETVQVQLKLWLDIATPSTEMGKAYQGKIRIDSVQLVKDGYVDDTGIVVTLAGNSKVVLLKDATYTEPGVTSIVDPIFGNLSTSNIKKMYEYYDGETLTKVSSVDTSRVGVYFITYTIENTAGRLGLATRAVVVNTTSTNVPSLSLNGNATILSVKGQLYNEQGATAAIPNGTTITDINMSGYVNTNVGGNYVRRYAVKSSNGNFDAAIRKIKIDWITYTFNYTGGYQTFEASYTGWYEIETWGASGGSGVSNSVTNTRYGKGGYSSGKIYLTEGEKLYVYVGGAGGVATTKTCSNTVLDTNTNTGGLAGWNGGGIGGNDGCTLSNAADDAGGGGGGATDIRYFGSMTPTNNQLQWSNDLGLNSRIMVAGGGGGSSWDSATYNAGSGGGLIGESAATHSSETDENVGIGGTQTAGHDFGEGAAGIYATSSNVGDGGGGAGYYGAVGHTTTSAYGTGGGGGSSYISGYAGVTSIKNSILTNNPRSHNSSTKHYSNKYFINGVMEKGTNVWNGSTTIKYIGTNKPTRINTSLNSVKFIKNCINGSTDGTTNHWVEIQAIRYGTNVALNKSLTTPGTASTTYGTGDWDSIVDGDITSDNYVRSATSSGNQCVIVNLGAEYDLDEVAIWHYWSDGRTYYENVTSVAGSNGTYRTVMDNTHTETGEGNRINAYRSRPPQNTLTINLNGGNVSYPLTHTVIVGDTLTLKAPTQDDYIFTGWSITGEGSSVNNNKIKMGSANATVTANWRPNTVIVTYNSEGGSSCSPSTIVPFVDQPYGSLCTTTRTGYAFSGWWTGANGSGAIVTSSSTVTITEDHNIYAKWTPNTYSVVYNGNGNTGGSTTSSTHTYGTAKNLTTNGFTKTGYTFVGWATSSTGDVVYENNHNVINLTATADEVITLYAKWSVNVATISYHINGGTLSGGSSSITSTNSIVYLNGNKLVTRVSYGQTIGTDGLNNPDNPNYINIIKTGYTPLSTQEWCKTTNGSGTCYSDSSSAYKGEDFCNLDNGNCEVTLYVNWEINTYSVVYNGNGNTGGSTAISTHTYGVAKALTANGFTRTGYTFAGWATSASGAVAYENSESVTNLTATNNATINLYAKWTANTYILTYDNQSGSGCNNKTVTYNSTYSTLCTPTRSGGYVFGGWWTGTNGSGSQITNSTTVTATQNHTIYAKWTKTLSSITITTQPSTKVYAEGATFSTSGMVVKASYVGGYSTAITGYTVTNPTLTWSTRNVTISYTDGGITKTATVAVEVTRTVTLTPTSYNMVYGRTVDDEDTKVYKNIARVGSYTATQAMAETIYRYDFSPYQGYTVKSAVFTGTFARYNSNQVNSVTVGIARNSIPTTLTAITWAQKLAILRDGDPTITVSSAGTYSITATQATQVLVDRADTTYGHMLYYTSSNLNSLYNVTSPSLVLVYSNTPRTTYSRIPASAQTANTYVSGSSVYGSTYTYYKAFDLGHGAYASSNSQTIPAWIQYDMQAAYRNIIVEISNRARAALINGPTEYYVVLSNDGTTWYNPNGTLESVTSSRRSVTGLPSGTGPYVSPYLGGSSISLGNTTGYRYIRIYFTNWSVDSGSSEGYLAIGEIGIWKSN